MVFSQSGHPQHPCHTIFGRGNRLYADTMDVLVHASLTDGSVNLWSHLHHRLLQRVVVPRPSVPVDAVGKGAVRAAQVPTVQVAVVAVAVPPAALVGRKEEFSSSL